MKHTPRTREPLITEKNIAEIIRQLLRTHNISIPGGYENYNKLLEELKAFNFKNLGKVLVDAIVKEKEYEKAVKAGIQAPTLSGNQHVPAELADYIYELTKK